MTSELRQTGGWCTYDRFYMGGHRCRSVVFPEAQHCPPPRLQYCGRLRVTLPVAPNLRPPEIGVRGWHSEMLGASMPKAPVDEDRDPGSGEEQVGRATDTRLGTGVHAVPESLRVDDAPYRKLGMGVATAIALHSAARCRARRPGVPHVLETTAAVLEVQLAEECSHAGDDGAG
jgi:hypothetical protein